MSNYSSNSQLIPTGFFSRIVLLFFFQNSACISEVHCENIFLFGQKEIHLLAETLCVLALSKVCVYVCFKL